MDSPRVQAEDFRRIQVSESYYLPSTQIDNLRAMLRSLPESDGVLRLNCEIPKYPNFFPGGRGHKGHYFPESPVMLIGHNFDTDIGFRASVARGAEDLSMPTWRRLKELFIPDSGEDEDQFFFTNFYLGAMVHPEPAPGKIKKTTNTGKFKCSRHFHNACVEALTTQVKIVRPKVIGLLGSNVPSAFSEAFPVYAPHCGSSLAETQAKQPVSGHRLKLLPDLRVQVVLLFHPASYNCLETLHAQGMILRAAIHAASTL